MYTQPSSRIEPVFVSFSPQMRCPRSRFEARDFAQITDVSRRQNIQQDALLCSASLVHMQTGESNRVSPAMPFIICLVPQSHKDTLRIDCKFSESALIPSPQFANRAVGQFSLCVGTVRYIYIHFLLYDFSLDLVRRPVGDIMPPLFASPYIFCSANIVVVLYAAMNYFAFSFAC